VAVLHWSINSTWLLTLIGIQFWVTKAQHFPFDQQVVSRYYYYYTAGNAPYVNRKNDELQARTRRAINLQAIDG
jgi:hypothetical protein